MIEHGAAVQFIRSLSGMSFFPVEEPAVKVLVEALKSAAVSREHAKRIVADLQADMERAPQVSHIRNAALATREDFSGDRPKCPNPDCPWVYVGDAVRRCKWEGHGP